MMAAMRLIDMKADKSISLKSLLDGYVVVDVLPDISITGMSLDSRKIQSGHLFVALAGQTGHGLDFAEMAVKKGAVAILCDRESGAHCQKILSVFMSRSLCVPVENLKKNLGDIASRFYMAPSKQLFSVGVTGTDGKTSVSHFIAQALDSIGYTSAVIGTIGNGLVACLEEASHTTPDVIQLQHLLADIVDKGATDLAIEVSSHGLDQDRVDALEFDVAVLTNLGRDHLDYHGDIKSYAEAKKKLFQYKSLKHAVLNLDDELGRQLAHELNEKIDVWGYTSTGEKHPNIKNIVSASLIKMHARGISLRINSIFGEADVHLNLMGRFNVSNVLASLSVLLIKGVAFSKAIQSIENLTTIPGRMQAISIDNKPQVIVDFAHTPQALESVLKSLRQHSKKKLICVFGCGGDRDKGKRALMAKVCEAHADEIIVTDDNPRTENAEAITNDIWEGFESAAHVALVHDRKQAICQAINNASTEDVILVAGKGHENFQIIGDIKQPFNDASVVAECLGTAE